MPSNSNIKLKLVGIKHLSVSEESILRKNDFSLQNYSSNMIPKFGVFSFIS